MAEDMQCGSERNEVVILFFRLAKNTKEKE